MIISHKYQFIFIKTHKTAGSSLEMGLGPLCGDEDVISSMETNDESGVPRNYYPKTFLGKWYANSKLPRKFINRHSSLIEPWYYEHMPAWRVKQQIGDEIWNSYYKFCFERNPWDKVVSYYLWKKHGQSKPLPSFKEYVLERSHRLPLDGSLYFTDSGDFMLDEVYQFKNLSEEMVKLCEKLEIPFSGELPREKTGIKIDRKPYQDYYDEETKQKVAELFSREIKLLCYEF